MSSVLEIVVQPAVQFAVGSRARLGQRQEHVVFGIGDRDDACVRLPMQPAQRAIWVTSSTASPRCMAAGSAVSGTLWSERRIRFGTPTSSPRCSRAWPRRIGVDPAEGHREAAQRFPLQVVVELAVVVAVQASVRSRRCRWPRTTRVLRTRDNAPIAVEVSRGPQDRRAVQIEPRAVEHQAGDAERRRRAAPTQPVQPQRHDQPARRMPVHQHLGAAGVRGDDRQRALEFAVVAGQVGGEVRRLARRARTGRTCAGPGRRSGSRGRRSGRRARCWKK